MLKRLERTDRGDTAAVSIIRVSSHSMVRYACVVACCRCRTGAKDFIPPPDVGGPDIRRRVLIAPAVASRVWSCLARKKSTCIRLVGHWPALGHADYKSSSLTCDAHRRRLDVRRLAHARQVPTDEHGSAQRRTHLKLRLASNGVCWISAPRASGVEGCGRYHNSVTPDARFGCRKSRVDPLAVEGGEVRTSV